MMKTIVILLVLGGLGAGGWYYWRTTHPANAAAATQTVEVALGSITKSVACTGQIVSNLDVPIKGRASGEIIELPIDISVHVKEGDLLVKLDPEDEQRRLEQATVDLRASQAKLEQSKQNLELAKRTLVTDRERAKAGLTSAKAKAKDAMGKAERRKALLTQNLGTQEDYDDAESAAQQAQADVQTAQAALDAMDTQELALKVKEQDVQLAMTQVEADKIAVALAQQQLSYTTVLAPMDGTISALTVQKGTIVSSAISNVGGGSALMTLSDLSRIFVLASVDESDIGRVRIDEPAFLTVDAYPGRRFRGKVVRIATQGVSTSNVVTFEVKIEVLDESKDLLKPQMTASVQLIEASKSDVLSVPTAAIYRTSKNAPPTTGPSSRPSRGDAAGGALAMDTSGGAGMTSGGDSGRWTRGGDAGGPSSRPSFAGGNGAGTRPAFAGGNGGPTSRSARRGGRGAMMAGAPENVFVTVVKPGGVQEERPIVIGLSDGNFAEVISGLTAGEQVVVRKNEADSRWRQQQQGPGGAGRMMMGMPGGGGGGGRR
jgi:HlyD family secretion protein